MNVKLAAQAPSFTVSKAFLKYGSPEAAGTEKFCCLRDRLFAIINNRDINS